MTAENIISANVRGGYPPFYSAEWMRESMTEKYGITPDNEAEVVARILAEEDARWAASVQEATDRKRKAEKPSVDSEKTVNKFPRNGRLEMQAKHGVAVAFQAYMKPLDEALEKLETKAASYKTDDFKHCLYSGDVYDLKRRMDENLALRQEAFRAIAAAFEHYQVTAEHFF